MSFVKTLITSSTLATLLVASVPIAHAMNGDYEGQPKTPLKAIAEEQIQFESDPTKNSGRVKGHANNTLLDSQFKGNTLVIGGITLNDPQKLSINVSGGDIRGSGWDESFLEQSFTNGKYDHILYEHVGYSLGYLGSPQGGGEEEYANEDNLAKIHFNLLKPEGTFDFLSWGDVFNNALSFTSFSESLGNVRYGMVSLNHCFKWVEDSENIYGKKLLVTLDNDQYKTYDSLPKYLKDITDKLNVHPFVIDTVTPLAKAGFRDIRVQFEKDGVLGFTRSHDSLHISAKKSNVSIIQ